MIEKRFNIPFVAGMALREKQIQQNYRPVIAVHKWFARRPGTLFRSLLLAEFAEGELVTEYFGAHQFPGRRVADPFMGGGTPLVEANRIGCATIGTDINPMAWWIVREQIEHLDLMAYRQTAERLRAELAVEIGTLYTTRCVVDGRKDALVKYFLWVKVADCPQCDKSVDLFPGYLLAEDVRHPRNVIVCPGCGELNEVADRRNPGSCKDCGETLHTEGRVARGKVICPHCSHTFAVPGKPKLPFSHRLFALEYVNPTCGKPHVGRFFKKPDADDLRNVAEAECRQRELKTIFTPDDIIPSGDETDRLHRWGYRRYREMFNARQLLGLELSCRFIAGVTDRRVRNALATNLSDLLRYQNMLCRYDTMALKSLDIFSVHGFPVGLIQVESNLLGIVNPGSAQPVGSGGWVNIIEKYFKAKEYCDQPFEIRNEMGRKTMVPVKGEWIGENRPTAATSAGGNQREVAIRCTDSASLELPAQSLDAVFTDPPYFGNVQYAELMDFCYVWLRRLAPDLPEFQTVSTRNPHELTANITAGRGMDHFAEGLGQVFTKMAVALKTGAPLAFTFHHNDPTAYHTLAVALLDARMVCSASLPCPAEMGASIHISGTGSSIIDTIFVCRSTGRTRRLWLAETPAALAGVVSEELNRLRMGGVKPTEGDARCITFGHLTRLAIWHLRQNWDSTVSTSSKLKLVKDWQSTFGDADAVLSFVRKEQPLAPLQDGMMVSEDSKYGEPDDEIPF